MSHFRDIRYTVFPHVAVLLLLMSPSAAAAQQSGWVEGVVEDEAGTGITAANVSAAAPMPMCRASRTAGS